MITKTRITLALIVLLFSIFPLSGFATNPDLSSYLINLSEGSQGVGLDDRVPEIVVVGTTVHTLWVQYKAIIRFNFFEMANSHKFLFVTFRRLAWLGNKDARFFG